MLTVGDRFPDFALTATVSTAPGEEFTEVRGDSHPGKWRVVFFWPMDFTFVCPTEIAGFGRRYPEFRERGCEVLGASVDTHYVHLAWKQQHPDLENLPFPMLADTRRELTSALGILNDQGVALRATFLVDPEGIIRHLSVNDLSVGRSIEEILRILDGFQSGDLTPCEWHRGDDTLGGA